MCFIFILDLEFIAERCPSEGHRNSMERSGLTSLVLNGKLSNDGEKYSHEPQVRHTVVTSLIKFENNLMVHYHRNL